MATPASLLLLAHIGGLPPPAPATEPSHRQRIVAGLLDTLVAADHLGLLPAHLTDAGVLFRQSGPPPAPAQVLAQARHLFEAFHAWLADFQALCPCHCLACGAVPGLTLRVMAHAGPLGPAVAVLRDLLASDVPAPDYVLFTHALLGPDRAAAAAWASARAGQLGAVGYVYLPLRDAADRPALARAGGWPFFRLHWPTHLPGLPDRLALN